MDGEGETEMPTDDAVNNAGPVICKPYLSNLIYALPATNSVFVLS